MDFEEAYPRKKRRPPKESALGVAFGILLLCIVFGVLVVPNILGRTGGSTKRPKADIAELVGAFDQFRLDCGRYPSAKEGFQALFVQPKNAPGWDGPYLKQRIPLDPWGNPYHYSCPGPTGHGYEVESYGADGKPGGDGDDADVTGGSDM